MVFITSNIRFSDIKLSTSSLAIMSPFFKALIAKYSPVFLNCDNKTCEDKIRIQMLQSTHFILKLFLNFFSILKIQMKNLLCQSGLYLVH